MPATFQAGWVHWKIPTAPGAAGRWLNERDTHCKAITLPLKDVAPFAARNLPVYGQTTQKKSTYRNGLAGSGMDRAFQGVIVMVGVMVGVGVTVGVVVAAGVRVAVAVGRGVL